MKDHNDYLPATLNIVDNDLERIQEQDWARASSATDEKLNYLYFMRDEINKRIKSERQKAAKAA